jgi:uncharacterized protein YbaR (Trm112 family)
VSRRGSARGTIPAGARRDAEATRGTNVAIDERLLEILVCPDCHGPVEHKERRHLIVCTSCGLRYPVREGIPVMLVEEASRPRGS